jgi:Zn-finger nucleic acid-binding protein
MNAETLNCPTCGAAVSTAATHCSFCDARLATVACPRCFAMMFVGSKHCSRCGEKATKAEKLEAASRRCPRCSVEMEAIAVGSASLRECARCDGMWVDVESFERIISEREEQAGALLGTPAQVEKQRGESHEPNKVRYVPCPECGQLMNRVNFARCSGVVVDVCKGHGTWFDRDELQQIVEFIRSGGLDSARAREKRELEEERRLLRQEQLDATLHQPLMSATDGQDRRSGVVSAARELLKLMIGE